MNRRNHYSSEKQKPEEKYNTGTEDHLPGRSFFMCPNFIWRKRRTLEREIARITSWNCSKSLPAMDDSTQEGVW